MAGDREELAALRRMAELEAKSGGEPASEMRPMAANAGLMNFGATLAGIPVDAVQNVLNLGRAAVGTATAAAGRPDLSPEIQSGAVGGSDWIKNALRKTGVAGISPDNPNPESKVGSAAYEMVSRGGFMPGGVLPAAGSLIAEKIGGPAWAGVGALLPQAAGQAVRAMTPEISPQAALLQKEGVSLTPGQVAGGTVKRVEDAATSIPLLGDAIKSAQRRGIESFDAAAMNRALAPIGEKLPKGAKGNGAVEYVYGKLGDAYDNLLPSLKGDLNFKNQPNALPASPGQAAPLSLREELDAIKNMGQNLPQPQRGQVGRIIENEITKRFTPQGLASGETLKDIESKLGGLAKGFRRSENYDVRTLGGAVEEMQNSLRRMVERVNPQYQGELTKINEGYANFKRVQNAASNVGAQEGVFTPAQLHRSVRAGDTSKDKARFSEGNALMQDLSAAGKSVLPSSVPDSGTPFRAAAMYALSHPLRAGLLGIPAAAATLPYTPMGQGMLQSVMNRQPQQGALQSLLAGILAQQQ